MTRREVEEMVASHGLVLISLTRNAHWKARVRTPGGAERNVGLPTSCSDVRGLKNKSAQLKKIAAGVL